MNSACPREFGRILEKILEKDRNLRCQSATELKTDLSRLKRDLESGHKRAAESSDSIEAAPARKAGRKVRGGALFRKLKRGRKKTNTCAMGLPKTSSPSFPRFAD